MPEHGERKEEGEEPERDQDDVGAKEQLENVGDHIRDAADEVQEAGEEVKKEVREKLDDAGPS